MTLNAQQRAELEALGPAAEQSKQPPHPCNHRTPFQRLNRADARDPHAGDLDRPALTISEYPVVSRSRTFTMVGQAAMLFRGKCCYVGRGS